MEKQKKRNWINYYILAMNGASAMELYKMQKEDQRENLKERMKDREESKDVAEELEQAIE